MFLAGGNRPDFRTINRFRREKGQLFARIFVQILHKAQELWIASFDVVSTDGTKIYADASKSRNADIESLEKQMKQLMEQADEIDSLEDEEFGEDDDESGIPEEFRTKEGRDRKRQEIKEKKKKTEER